MSGNQPKAILIVATEPEFVTLLSDTLTGDGRFVAEQSITFYDALDKIVTGDFALVLVDNKLPDMTGLDLLTAASRLLPDLPIIVIDRQLSARSALAAFRLGAADYIARPFQPDMLLMQVTRILRRAPRQAANVVPQAEAAQKQPDMALDQPEATVVDDLALEQAQVMAIIRELTQFQGQVGGSFASLLDENNRMIASAGSLKNVDMDLVKDALTVNKAKGLARALDEQRFSANYLGGEFYNVYSVEFGEPVKVSLITICESSVKSGVVLFFAKQAAENINDIIQQDVLVPG